MKQFIEGADRHQVTLLVRTAHRLRSAILRDDVEVGRRLLQGELTDVESDMKI